MLANSDNRQDLIKHLRAVMLMAMYSAKQIGVVDTELINLIGISSFLHDVGKCTTYFQHVTLQNENVNKHYKKCGEYYPRHNEVSWLYVISRGTKVLQKIGAQAVYWHHGTVLPSSAFIGDEKRLYKDIVSELESFEENVDDIFNVIDNIIKEVNFPFDLKKFINFDSDIDNNETPISTLFREAEKDDIDNAKRMIVRSCLIFADNIVSKLSIDELDELLLDQSKFYPKHKDISYDDFRLPSDYDKDRFVTQNQIVKDSERTTVVKAPAGFGKSLIGLLWSKEKQGTVYWVCPRNSVAIGVFHNLISEIEKFKLNISIELFLTSERKDHRNGENIPECGCDIVVTNIDNLLAPMVDHKSANRLFSVISKNVVFDEFHEFVSEEALFGAFVVCMKARHLLATECNTLLLSATPSLTHRLWNGRYKTKVLPNEEEHYKPQHSEKYNVKVDSGFVDKVDSKSLTMYSSVRNVQNNFDSRYTHIAHGNYSEEEKENKVKEIINAFGKGAAKNGTVISAPILQAALDISFNALYKTIESPEYDIQTIGRINRWGEIRDECVLRFLTTTDRSEISAINTRYSFELTKLWQKELSKVESVDLESLYKLYNQFNIKNEKVIYNYVNNKYQESLKDLRNFFPRQPKEKINDGKLIASKSLRDASGGYFIVSKSNSVWCSFSLSVTSLDMEDLLSNSINVDKFESSTINTVIVNLEKLGFDYSEIKSKLKSLSRNPNKFRNKAVDLFKKAAKCSSSPMPVFNWTYDNTLGLLKND
jgi:CRISPR-associated endonuclease Cas3-HD